MINKIETKIVEIVDIMISNKATSIISSVELAGTCYYYEIREMKK